MFGQHFSHALVGAAVVQDGTISATQVAGAAAQLAGQITQRRTLGSGQHRNTADDRLGKLSF